ncbi:MULTISPECIES: hypothetical protein [unclassified Arcicella]|uniref:hypothetical protein n=1 Tax=unclassified Arcicella TaxID=2644986 RepID=UPI00285CB29E|nr:MULTISPECIES: hypothetical protein [unclassified Arcicella]MDR6560686.1 hypothetical protein [Arcicella sp. BE51]MDR6810570.1 hypothetical protein [Arcicella sp. BE140]MDR6821920.1 hypothetical protein [Arcicella sp. BE139]
MTQRLSHKKTNNIIPLLKKGEYNSYRPEDIKRWGIERFLETVCASKEIEVPNLGFNDEENNRMDSILKDENKEHDF